MDKQLQELYAKGQQALQRIAKDPQAIYLQISKLDAVMLCGQLQLALRHPGNRGGSASTARALIEAIKTAFAMDPDILQMLTMGNDPRYDQPPTAAPGGRP